jgi:glycosyltransferase involved in cell wall biosynthesis
MAIKISVVTATLNRKDYLPRCIEGVAGQSYPHKEHLIIDGGSTDGTLDILQSYAKKYPHIKWISEKDNGVSSALNKGFALATGDVIGVNGDDDYYQPGAFEIVAAEFEQDPSVGVVSGNCEHILNDGTGAHVQKSGFTNRQDLIEYWKNWGVNSFLPHPSTFIRRQVIDVVGGFEEADLYCMDYHHWIKINEKFRVKTVDRVLASFRYDQGSITYSRAKEQWAEMYGISKKYWGSKASLSFYRTAWAYFYYHKCRPLSERVRNSFKYRVGNLLGN